jgi:hypothetical protein
MVFVDMNRWNVVVATLLIDKQHASTACSACTQTESCQGFDRAARNRKIPHLSECLNEPRALEILDVTAIVFASMTS